MATTFVDKHVGKRLRQRRTLLGLSQTDIGKPLGVTFQQIQKYENGTNRISIGALLNFAQQLGVSIGYFIEELPESAKRGRAAEDPLTKRETLELVRTYYKMKPKERDALRTFMNTLAG